MLAGQGFEIIASGAFIAQHSMTKEVGAGRPDEEDRKEIRDFAVKVLAKLEKSQKNVCFVFMFVQNNHVLYRQNFKKK